MGWTEDKWIQINGQVVYPEHPQFIQGFLYEWTTGLGLKEAKAKAKQKPTLSTIKDKELKIFGYGGLKRLDYNR
jgi:hypothetical protein